MYGVQQKLVHFLEVFRAQSPPLWSFEVNLERI